MKFLSWSVADPCSSFAVMSNLLSYRKKNRCLVECFLQTQNNISLLLPLPPPSVRMEWVILATNLLCSWLWWCLKAHEQFSWEWFALVLFPFPQKQLSCHGVMLCCHWSGVQGRWRLGLHVQTPSGGACAEVPWLWCVFPAAGLASSTSSPCSSVCNTRSPRGGKRDGVISELHQMVLKVVKKNNI